MKLHYTLVIEHDAEDNAYNVTVPLLPGCVTYGETVQEAIERAEEAIIGHVETLHAHGEEIPIEDTTFQLATVDVEVPVDQIEEGEPDARHTRR